MSRLSKTNEIIELAILMQNSYNGLTVDEIAQKFECSRRTAERMKAILVKNFPEEIEETQSGFDRKKRWKLQKGTINRFIHFTAADFSNLELCKKSFKSKEKQREMELLIEKIKALNPVKTQL